MTASDARSGEGFDLVVMIASLGGLQSVTSVLSGLPADFPVSVVLLQHGARRDAAEVLAPLLQRRTEIPVRTARDQDVVDRPGVTVIPHGCSALLDADYRMQLIPADRSGGGDALLRSAAHAAGRRLIAVVLTGLLNDGADGVRAVKRQGGRVLVEDPQTARAASMPTSALATGCVDFAIPRTRLASALVALALAPGGADLFIVPTPAWATLGA
jgi:two-component system chemotaxis response regulator CheB